jgi:hypothetical protein
MATRSAIGIKLADTVILAVYCHWDGYLQGVGQTLVENYNTEENILDLLALGDISSLGKVIREKSPQSTTFYGRDLGEFEATSLIFKSEADFLEEYYNRGAEYCYLFQNNQWTFASYDDTEFSDVVSELALDEKTEEM